MILDNLPVNDIARYLVDMNVFYIDEILIDANVLYAYRPSCIHVGYKTAYELIGINTQNTSISIKNFLNDIDAFILSSIADSMVYNMTIHEIIASLEEYIFNTYTIICSIDLTAFTQLYHTIVNSIDKLLEKYTKTFANIKDIENFSSIGNYPKFFLIKKFNCHIDEVKSNININLLLFTSK